MNAVMISKVVLAICAFLAVGGIEVAPETQSTIVQGFVALIGIYMAIRIELQRRQDKEDPK